MSPARWIALGCAMTGLAAPAVGQVATNTPALPVYAPLPAANLAVVVTLLRHRPLAHESVPADKVGDCQSLAELSRLLRAAGPLEVLCHARRELACAPAGRAVFQSLESRPAFLPQAGAAAPTNAIFGLDLHADARIVSPVTGAAPPVVILSWEGQWKGSGTLLANWEKIALRAFNLARTVPGITYTKVEPDEDGFVNTGGGTDVGGLFRRKKTKVAAKKGAPAAAAVANPTAPSEREPSYAAEPAPEIVPLQGQWIGAAGQLLVSRRTLSVGDNPGELYLVVQALSVD